MTCIATDGRTMASDGRIHVADLIQTDCAAKMGHAWDGSVVGVAGPGGAIVLVLKWFADGERPDCLPDLKPGPDDDSGFEALILRPDGTAWRIDDTYGATPADLPFAIGSGAPVAMAAMHCGRSPKQAVRLAARLILTVGGEITTMRPRNKRTGK